MGRGRPPGEPAPPGQGGPAPAAGEPDHHHGSYEPAVWEALPLAPGTHPDRLVELVEEAGWGTVRLERLRDVEWAQLLSLPPAVRLLGVTPRFAVVAG